MLTPTGVTLAEYNAALLAGNTTHVRMVFQVQNVTITDADISADNGIHINTVLNTETDLVIGKAVASEVTVRIINHGQFSGFDWAEEFHVDFGVDISGTTNWVTAGYFTGKKPDRTVRTETIEFTAYDRMLKFDKLADDFLATVTFPATMETLFQGLCAYVGLSYAAGDEDATTMAVSYAENPFTSGTNCRQILAWIAEANGCYAKITADGKVKLVWFTDHTADYTLDGDHYFDINIDEATAPVVDTIRVSSTEDESAGSVYPVGTPIETYNIIDNPLLLAMSAANRTTVMTSILARFTAFGAYVPMTLTAIGNWLVEAGDIIEIDEGGNTLTLPVFSRVLEWTGACFDQYVCTGETTRTEMTETAKEQYETGGKLANKYTIQSGVDITDEGVTVSGGKYIKLISGGILDVQATNFIIDSENKYMQTGNWIFKTNGLYRKKTESQGSTETLFEIGESSGETYDTKMGIYTGFYQRNPSSGTNYYYSSIDFVKNRTSASTNGIRISPMYYAYPITPIPADSGSYFGGSEPAIVPITNGTGIIGHPNYKFKAVIANLLAGDEIKGDCVKNNLTTTTEGYALDARQGKALNTAISNLSDVVDDKADDSDVVHKTGAETIGGSKTFSADPSVKHNSSRYKDFIFGTSGGTDVGAIRFDTGANSNTVSVSRMRFVQYSPKTTAATSMAGGSEQYMLPACATGLTDDNTYSILTTKAAVTVAQGGTGATSASGARVNLGVPSNTYFARDTSPSSGLTHYIHIPNNTTALIALTSPVGTHLALFYVVYGSSGNASIYSIFNQGITLTTSGSDITVKISGSTNRYMYMIALVTRGDTPVFLGTG